MKKNKLIVGAVALGLGIASFGAGVDAKGKGPADGTCVAQGVKSLGGPAIAGAARAGLVSTVILDHVFEANSLGVTTATC